MDKILEQNRVWANQIFEKLDKKLARVAVKSRDKLPYSTINGEHYGVNYVNAWTNGFWGGMMWLMYNETGNEEYRKTAVRSEEMLDEGLGNFIHLHHDVGFMWHLTSGASYRLTGDKKSLNRNLFAAASLFSRYNVDGGYIRAWNEEYARNYTIIDCLMNIPLLYWASQIIDDDRFKKIAMRHADMAVAQHIRTDGSINHIVEHNPDNGGIVKIHKGQGYSETSCWTRGLAWAIYGTVLSYIHTGKKSYLDASVKCADYYLRKCEEYGYITPIDFDAPKEPLYTDTTATACTACGLIELSRVTGDNKYIEFAIKSLKAMEKYYDFSETEDSVLQMGSVLYPHTPELMKDVHVPIIYGDFFLVEAILKLKGSDFLIW